MNMSKKQTRRKRLRKTRRGASYGGGYTYGTRRRRGKADWAGPSLGDAYKANLPHYVSLPARRLFLGLCLKVQRAVAALTGAPVAAGFEAQVKPQLSPCYTSYPDSLAAPAAIGQTGFLEYRARVRSSLLTTHLQRYLAHPARRDDVSADPDTYQRLARLVTMAVQTRLLLADLARMPGIAGFIELYRLFAASQQSLRFQTVKAIVDAVVLYGDVLPDPERLPLHPMTRALMNDVQEVSAPFFDELARAEPHRLKTLGARWVQSVCRCLAKYLPDLEEDGHGEQEPEPAFIRHLRRRGYPVPRTEPDRFKFSEGPPQASSSEHMAPLDEARPPSLLEPPSLEERLERALRRAVNQWLDAASGPRGEETPTDADEVDVAVRAFARSVELAAGQQSLYDDVRFDILEEMLRDAGFSEGPIEGHPADGHLITFRAAGDKAASGELFDRPVELTDDPAGFAALQQKARPITEMLRRALYPNRAEVPEAERYRTSGALDPSRLARALFSEAVYRRYRITERVDRRGSPVLLIACDGSSSLDARQIAMLKTLTWAWLESTSRSDVQVLAGLYHSGRVRPGVSGPLVQWMYHPHKTPAFGHADALRALLSLPDSGTGAQADALSLEFMLSEARRLSRGRMIYLILLSDCAWNRSFPELGQSGQEEVLSFFESAYEELGAALHTTLVALGVAEETGFEGLLDRVIPVADEDLTDPEAVAADIGLYVASVMRERRRLLSR